MTSARRLHYDYAEYQSALAESQIKLEYCDGVIYAMAGRAPAHAQLAAAMIVALHGALPRTCRIATSDQKIRVEATDLTTFPDVSVVCGPSKSSAIDSDAITNPIFLVEVTSKSTEDYDRGDKLSQYRQIPSLRAVIFVSHRAARITVVERRGKKWAAQEYRAGETVRLQEHSFAVDDIYEGIKLGSGPSPKRARP